MARPFDCFAIKAKIDDPDAPAFVFFDQKTMYGGRFAAVGDPVFIFASDHDGGRGLLARGILTACAATPRSAAIRQTPRISLTIERTATAIAPLGRRELQPFRGRSDGTPEAELDFKLYRQATNKVVGLTDDAARFLAGHFR